MGLILIRYGEIALKGQNRNYFFRKLRRNVRLCLKENTIDGRVWQEGQRIYLETEQVERAVDAVQRVFGIVSLSPVSRVPANLDAVAQEAVAIARRAGLGPDRSFRVTARRVDKTFPVISPEIQRQVGAAVVAATNAPVDLSGGASLDIGVEVQRGRALLFGEIIAGPGGLPLGSQGRVVALLSSGIDSPVAAWLMMKRGCSVIPLHLTVGQAQTEQVEAIVAVLNRYAYGSPLHPLILSHEEVMAPIVEELHSLHRERWTCLLCKRAMLARATEIAADVNASALVTGDSLGQVASQTLANLEIISQGVDKPILRPLIGYDKSEIMALARRIGTYEASIQNSYACPFLPDRPLTQGSLEKFRALLEQMEENGRMHPAPVRAPKEGVTYHV